MDLAKKSHFGIMDWRRQRGEKDDASLEESRSDLCLMGRSPLVHSSAMEEMTR